MIKAKTRNETKHPPKPFSPFGVEHCQPCMDFVRCFLSTSFFFEFCLVSCLHVSCFSSPPPPLPPHSPPPHTPPLPTHTHTQIPTHVFPFHFAFYMLFILPHIFAFLCSPTLSIPPPPPPFGLFVWLVGWFCFVLFVMLYMNGYIKCTDAKL